MANLKDFFAQNVSKIENIKYVASDRIVSEGRPAEWEIRAINSVEDAAIKKRCTKQVTTAIKGQYRSELDVDLYAANLAVACTVFPDLNNAELQNSYEVMGAVELLRTMLSIGEYNDYLLKVQEVNGFNKTMDELVDDAKN